MSAIAIERDPYALTEHQETRFLAAFDALCSDAEGDVAKAIQYAVDEGIVTEDQTDAVDLLIHRLWLKGPSWLDAACFNARERLRRIAP